MNSQHATNLVDLISYQEGAVVSREIVKKPTGTVTLFAFAKDQGLSEHTTPFEALVLILDGEAEITIDRKPNVLGKGQFIVMPANHPHAVKALTPFKMLLIMIRS